MAYLISQLIIGTLMKLFIKKIYGKDNIIADRPFIIACNHASYIDDFAVPTILYPTINRKFHFYVNSSYFKNFFLRMFLNHYESIPVVADKGKNHKRVNKKAYETALQYLERGDIIFIFPEGTRTLIGKLQKGKTGVARLALKARVPVLPVGLAGTFKILPKGKYIPKLKKATMNIGKLMYLEKYYNKKITRKLLREVTDDIMKEIAKLSGQKYNF